MAILWETFTHQLGAKFTNQYGSAGGKAFLAWAKTLRTIDDATLREAFRLFLRSSEKFFDLQTYRHFIVKAKCSALGIHDIDDARYFIDRKCWNDLHPAFQHIFGARMFDLKFASAEKSERLFKKLYEELCDRVLAGEKFERPVALPFPPKKEFGKDRGRSEIKELLKEMKGA